MSALSSFLSKEFKEKKLNSPFGIGLLAFIAIGLGFLISYRDILSGALLVGVPLGIGVLILIFTNHKAALIFIFVFSFLITLFSRAAGSIAVPYGTIIEILTLLSFLGILLKKYVNHEYDWGFARDPITYIIIAMCIFTVFQIANPNSKGLEGYMMVAKRSLSQVLFFIICIYALDNKKTIGLVINIWIGFTFITAIYACYQEYFGFLKFENDFLFSSESVLRVFFVDGRFRKFSIFDNPTNFGINTALATIFLITNLIKKINIFTKIGYILMIGVMLMAVGYSGTRTAYAMITGGLFFFFLLNLNRKDTIILASAAALGLLVILYGPFEGNYTIYRIRTTFNPEQDASYNVRDINRHAIQPYIYKNPMGGGLATSGGPGARYNPSHQLAGFPPDSEYLRVTLETGVVGLFFILLCHFLIMNTVINRYYATKNNAQKIFFGALASCIFAIMLANYSQETSNMFPNDYLLYLFFALIVSYNHLNSKSLKTKQEIL